MNYYYNYFFNTKKIIFFEYLKDDYKIRSKELLQSHHFLCKCIACNDKKYNDEQTIMMRDLIRAEIQISTEELK